MSETVSWQNTDVSSSRTRSNETGIHRFITDGLTASHSHKIHDYDCDCCDRTRCDNSGSISRHAAGIHSHRVGCDNSVDGNYCYNYRSSDCDHYGSINRHCACACARIDPDCLPNISRYSADVNSTCLDCDDFNSANDLDPNLENNLP